MRPPPLHDLRPIGLLVLALSCAGCGDAARQPEPAATTAEVPPPAGPPGRVFDPARLRVGDEVLGLRVAAANIQVALDSTHVGEVRFAGILRVRGTPIWHFDHPEVDLLCFEVDSSSVNALPRWPRDERRRVWFCFDNRDEAVARLGPPRPGRSVTIEIDDYQTVRHPTDAFDTARLVRVMEDAP